MKILLWAAAAMAGVTFFVHTFIGGKFVARPLLADGALPKASKWLNYYCWHITTLVIVALAIAFCWLAVAPNSPAIAALSLLTAAFSALSAGVATKGGVHPLRFPSTSLFAAVSILGWCAFLTGR